MRLHPITKRRWARFRGMRRAWWAFWVLVAGYGVSLFSEWIANDRPLFVRMGGKCYWPVVKFYPEDAFNGSGRMTRPDYRALERDGAFEGAVVVWPPLRWGPLESVPAGSIELPKVKTVVAVPEEHAAYAEIDGEGRIVRVGGEADRFGLARGGVVDEAALPEGVREGLAARRADKAAGAVEGTVEGGRTVALSPYEPRGAAPSRVRVTWREAPVAGGTLKAVVDDVENPVWPEGFPVPGTPGWTHRESREEVRFPMRPVKGHPLGLDSSGRDVAARMLYALRTSLSFGLLLVVATMGLGTLAGAVQGYCAGAVDLVGQRVIEIWESLPFLYVLILLGSVYGQGFGLLLGVYALFNWVGISHYMRAEFLRLRKQPFVEAAQGLGLSGPKIVFRHILPNALVPLVTFFPFQLVGAIGSMAALDYLGFGLPPPSPSWGELLAQAQEFPWAWWLALYPALALFAVMLAGVFVGEGLRAAYDPRPVSRWE